jgi:hypothetical protein
VHIRTGPGGAKKKYFTENDLSICISGIKKYLSKFNTNSIFLTGGRLYGVVSGIEEGLRSSGINVYVDNISSYKRDSVDWLRDMEILSRCKLVMGHVGSTYASASANIKSKDFIDIKTDKKIELPYSIK